MSENFKTCRYCGKEIFEDASFCIYCMSELNERKEINAPEPHPKRRARLILLLSLVPLSVIILFAALNINNREAAERGTSAVFNEDAAVRFDLRGLSAEDLSSMKHALLIEDGFSYDLDGDGFLEIISFNLDEMQNIVIDGNLFKTNIEDGDLPADFEVFAGDVDSSDAFAEIFIVQSLYGENGGDSWLYIYRYDGENLDQFTFDADIYVKDRLGNAIPVPVLDSPRAHMPGQPIYLTEDGRIGWKNVYSASDKEVYRFFELQDGVFTETEHVIIR